MGVKRKKLVNWDEVQAAEAVVAFYEKRLEEALEKLGRLVEEMPEVKDWSTAKRGMFYRK